MHRFFNLSQAEGSQSPTLILAAAVTLALAGSGCENEESQANRRLRAKLEEAHLASFEEKSTDNVQTLLKQAAQETAASPAQKALANALIGQSSYSAAIEQLDALSTAETQVLREIANISRAGASLTLDSATIEAFRASNPAGNETDKPIAAIQGNKQKFQQQGQAVQQQLNQITQQLQTAQQKTSELQQKLNQTRSQAADLTEKSDAAGREGKSQDSLTLFKQAADARAEAMRVGTELGHTQTDAARLEAQQAALQADLKTLQDSAAASDRQLENLQTVWTETQKLIEERGASLRDAMGEKGIGGLTKALNDGQAKADELRTTIADTHLQAAIDGFAKAAAEAQQLQNLASTEASANPAVKPAWDRLQQLHSASRYKLDQARALQLRGTLHLRHKQILEARKRLIEGLTALVRPVNLTLPAELTSANLDDQIKAAATKAEEDLKASESLVENIADSGRDKMEKSAALSLRSATRFSLYALNENQQHLTDARNDLQQLADDKVSLPPLPATLTGGLRAGPAPEGTTPAPGRATPTSEGATPPTEGTPPASPTTPQPTNPQP